MVKPANKAEHAGDVCNSSGIAAPSVSWTTRRRLRDRAPSFQVSGCGFEPHSMLQPYQSERPPRAISTLAHARERFTSVEALGPHANARPSSHSGSHIHRFLATFRLSASGLSQILNNRVVVKQVFVEGNHRVTEDICLASVGEILSFGNHAAARSTLIPSTPAAAGPSGFAAGGVPAGGSGGQFASFLNNASWYFSSLPVRRTSISNVVSVISSKPGITCTAPSFADSPARQYVRDQHSRSKTPRT